MPTSNAPDSTVYNTFVDCMRRGASVRLTLRNGEVVDRFRTHDIIAPKGPLQLLPDMGKAKVRGVSRPDREASVHGTFSLRDIVLVEDEPRGCGRTGRGRDGRREEASGAPPIR